MNKPEKGRREGKAILGGCPSREDLADRGKPYSQITQWGDRKLAYALERSITGTQWTPGIPRETTRRPRPIPRRREATGMAP